MYEKRMTLKNDFDRQKIVKRIKKLEEISRELEMNIGILENDIIKEIHYEEIKKDSITNHIFEILSEEGKTEKEQRIKVCEYLLSSIRNMTSEELEQHLSMIGFDNKDLRTVIHLKF